MPQTSLSQRLRLAILCTACLSAALIGGFWWHALVDANDAREEALSAWDARQYDLARHVAYETGHDLLSGLEQGRSLDSLTQEIQSRLRTLPLPFPETKIFIWTRTTTLLDRRLTGAQSIPLNTLQNQQTQYGGDLTPLVRAAQDGTDGYAAYRWSTAPPLERASWASIRLPGDTWTIFLSTPEEVVLKATTAAATRQRNLAMAFGGSLVIALLTVLYLRHLTLCFQALGDRETAQQRQAQAEQQAEELALSFEGMPLPQALLDAQGTILRANRHFCDSFALLGTSGTQPPACILPAGWAPRSEPLQSALQEALRNGHARAEVALPSPGGQQRQYMLHLSALRHAKDRAEAPALLLGLVDVTEARQLSALLEESRRLLEDRVLERTEALASANKQLEKSRRRTQALLDNMADIAWLKDAAGRYISVNAPFAASLGLHEPQEVAGLLDSVVLPAAGAWLARTIDQQVVHSRKPNKVDQPINIPGEGLRWHEVIRTPILDEAGLVVGIVGIARDMTEHRKMMDELKASEAELRRLNRLLLSSQEEERSRIGLELHDSVGQMLTGIKWLVESAKLALGKGKAAEAARQALDKVVPMVQRTEEELASVLLALRPKVLDDLGLVAALHSMCREFEQGHPGVLLVQRVEPETVPLQAELRTTVFRLVQEALNNVSRHSGATKVVLILRREGGTLTLRVGDNGRGFNAHAEHPGLGLHNFQNRSSYAGGTYTLYTRPGAGCALHFTFPLTRGAKAV